MNIKQVGGTGLDTRPAQGKKPIEVVGHRGDVFHHIENTVSSVRSGWAKGDAVEVDVQMTRDGKLILFHDDHLSPHGFHMPGEKKQKAVTRYTLQELQEKAQFNQSGWEAHMTQTAGKPVRYQLDTPATIPTLDELLPVPKDKRIYFEIKRPSIWRPYFDNLERKLVNWIQDNQLEDRAVVISFNPWSLLKVKKFAPHIKTGLDDEHHATSPYKGPVLWATKKLLKLDYLIPDAMNTTQRLVRHCHRMGMKIVPYMPIGGYQDQKDPARNSEMKMMKNLIQMGVDGIVTNEPEQLKQTLAQSPDNQEG